MAIEIKNELTQKVIYSSNKTSSVRETILEALVAGADLRGADLSYVESVGAYLSEADLTAADPGGADPSYANPSYAGFCAVKNDFFMVLFSVPSEIAGLLAKFIAGDVDGSCYEGDCANLLGTIANVKGVNFLRIEGLTPDENRPAEKFFGRVREGDTPQNSLPVRLAVQWIDEFEAKLAHANDVKTGAANG